MFIINTFIFYLINISFASNIATDSPEKLTESSATGESLYRHLFKLERGEQLEAVKSLLKLNQNEKQMKLVQAIVENVFKVLKKSQKVLEDVSYLPGVSLFPENEQTKDALSNILENTAFLGDIILRLPDITEALLSNNSEWISMYKWSIAFSKQSNLMDAKTSLLLDLVNQELNFTKRNEKYTNPYRKPRDESQQITTKLEETKKSKRKRTFNRGPRLSATFKTEL